MIQGVVDLLTRRATEQRRILYVEDDAPSRALVAALLELDDSVELLQAENGLGGLALARAEQPDLILLDVNLPGMTGDVLLAELRADDRTREIPVVIISSLLPHEAGIPVDQVSDYFVKPITDLLAFERRVRSLAAA